MYSCLNLLIARSSHLTSMYMHLLTHLDHTQQTCYIAGQKCQYTIHVHQKCHITWSHMMVKHVRLAQMERKSINLVVRNIMVLSQIFYEVNFALCNFEQMCHAFIKHQHAEYQLLSEHNIN